MRKKKQSTHTPSINKADLIQLKSVSASQAASQHQNWLSVTNLFPRQMISAEMLRNEYAPQRHTLNRRRVQVNRLIFIMVHFQ